MSEIPTNNPEKKELLDDNARKFKLDTIDPEFLKGNGAISYLLTTDWLKVDEGSEEKLARKEYENGEIEYLLIQKFTDKNGNRTVPPKKKLTLEQYQETLAQVTPQYHGEKVRYELEFAQNGITFSVKYDEFVDSSLRMLEVDAANEELRKAFDMSEFPYKLTEVTGDPRYYGYRVTEMV